MADVKRTKSDDSKMTIDDRGDVFGVVVEDPRMTGDGTHKVLRITSGISPIDTGNISSVYLDSKRPAWYTRVWRWIRGK